MNPVGNSHGMAMANIVNLYYFIATLLAPGHRPIERTGFQLWLLSFTNSLWK